MLGYTAIKQKEKIWTLTRQILHSACLSEVTQSTERLSDLLKATQQLGLPSTLPQVRFLMKSYSFLREAVPGTLRARRGEAFILPSCELSPLD